MVDATDLKSVGAYAPCGFESRSRYSCEYLIRFEFHLVSLFSRDPRRPVRGVLREAEREGVTDSEIVRRMIADAMQAQTFLLHAFSVSMIEHEPRAGRPSRSGSTYRPGAERRAGSPRPSRLSALCSLSRKARLVPEKPETSNM